MKRQSLLLNKVALLFCFDDYGSPSLRGIGPQIFEDNEMYWSFRFSVQNFIEPVTALCFHFYKLILLFDFFIGSIASTLTTYNDDVNDDNKYSGGTFHDDNRNYDNSDGTDS